MKIVLLAAAICLAAGTASAQMDTGPNTLGAYFDAEGSIDCAYPVPNLIFDLYWILTNAEADTIFGFEFAWAYDPEITPRPLVLGLFLPPYVLSESTTYNLIVGLGYGYATSDATVLAHYWLYALTPLPDLSYITVGPATPASIPGHAAILYAGATEPVPLAFAGVDELDDQGWSVPGVAQINVSCTTPVVAQTWGAVKALFR